MSSLYETLKSTALSHVKAYESPPFHNPTIQQYRTPSCVHSLHPAESIPSPFNLPIDPPAFAEAMTFFGGPISKLSFEVKDVIVDVEKLSVVVRLVATYDFAAFADEEEVTGWTTEYMWLTEMEESGKKVKRVEEFLDPGRLMGFVKGRAEKWAQVHGEQGKEGE